MERITAALRDIAGAEHVLCAAAVSDDYTHDEALTVVPKRPVSNELGTLIPGCGHVGDGNVHLSVFQPDRELRYRAIKAVYRAGMQLGGVISGERGIGTEKMRYFLELEAPAKLALMRRIKAAFDAHAILNPGSLLG